MSEVSLPRFKMAMPACCLFSPWEIEAQVAITAATFRAETKLWNIFMETPRTPVLRKTRTSPPHSECHGTSEIPLGKRLNHARKQDTSCENALADHSSLPRRGFPNDFRSLVVLQSE